MVPPLEPILSDDDAETSDSENVASRHSKSSESGDDDTGSGSESECGNVGEGSGVERGDDTSLGSESDFDNGAGGDSAPLAALSRKRMMRASRA
mgnify:CR=1 FL=1